MLLGQAITKLAEEKKLTKYRISKNAQMAQTTLGEIANGKNTNPTLETLERIAKGLGTSVSEVLMKAEQLEEDGTNGAK